MHRSEAVSLAIFAINTFLAPDASSDADTLYLEEHAEETLTELVGIRNMLADADADAEPPVGLHTTTDAEQYARGLAAGRAERAKRMSPDALERRIAFDRERVETGLFDGRAISTSQLAFHRGRLDAMRTAV